MEIYRGSSSVVGINLPPEVRATLTAIDVFAVENGVSIYEWSTVVATTTGFEVTIPWSLARQDRDFNVEWRIAYTEAGVAMFAVENTYVQLVTPVLTLEEVANIASLDLTTQRSDVLDLERRVRYGIQTYTGQNFGKFAGSMQVSGNGSVKLNLPAPLLEFTGFAYDGVARPAAGLTVINNGWGLSGGRVYIDSIKQAPPEWMLDNWDYTGVIRHPYVYGHNFFHDGVEYTINGVWGYQDVPGDVRQAARLLVSDYSCDESLWRERYIDSVRAGDWRFEFNAQAFDGTGNVQADQILAGYRRATMVVV